MKTAEYAEDAEEEKGFTPLFGARDTASLVEFLARTISPTKGFFDCARLQLASLRMTRGRS